MLDKYMVRKAYKKLKANVYHDKTMPLLRQSIMKFESCYGKTLDEYLDDIYNWFESENVFYDKVQFVLDSIDVVPLPKNFEENMKDETVISNYENGDCYVKDIQYFIDMPVIGHILGTLWVMLIGCRLDKSLDKNIYGNRISKYLVNSYKTYSDSTYLFEPYFIQYESWRDKGLQCAENIIASKDNVIIITLDLERYYYSLDINSDVMECMLGEACKDDLDDKEKTIYVLLNGFVGDVIKCYSDKMANKFQNRKVLPIGFLPSNIISNWFLKDFDRAIINGWNPVYYARYVDDILIVDSVSNDEYICKDDGRVTLSKEEAIDLYLTYCNKWIKSSEEKENCCDETFALAMKITDENNEIKYIINPRYYSFAKNKSQLNFNLRKVKLFYFKWQESTSLITCFKKQISKNKSEFRYMPDEEAFRKDDYTDIYELINEAGVNKLRGIKNFEVNKYELSKFIGKYLRICAMIDSKVESKFEKEILKIFNKRVILENYTLWEKIIEILIIKENYKGLKQFCDRVYDSIDAIKSKQCKEDVDNIKDRLRQILYVNLCRCLALVWKKSRKNAQLSLMKDFFIGDDKKVDSSIIGYCETRMIDKSVMPIPFDMLNLKDLSCDSNLNFTSLDDCVKHLKKTWDSSYKYFPYMLNVIDFCLISNWEFSMSYPEEVSFKVDNVFNRYFKTNFNKDFSEDDNKMVQEFSKDNNIRYIIVENGKSDNLRIAIANVVLDYKDFEKVVLENYNRSYKRYQSLSHIVNEAIDSNADMLVMPEAYVPYEWLPALAQTCKKEQMAIITGIEHIKLAGKIWNFTAVMLPYEVNDHKDAYINFHLKNHYAPSEIDSILGYGLSYEEGDTYELYKWNDCYFPVYCCYELSSIKDRSIFQSLADFIVAVEWNRDVKYYSNIAESLSRDMHCYFVQVNSANYGDSRIVKPSRDVEKDLIRTKGGINSSVLVDDMEIKKLREFQIKQYNLQKMDKSFKPTPPNFDRNIVMRKIKNEIDWE